MKRFLFCLVLSGFSVLNSFSQRFEGGVIAGLSATQVDGDTFSGYNKPGLVAGGYVQTNLSRNLFAGFELKFAQKGSRKNPDPKATDDQSKYIMRLNYAEMPFYLGIRTNDRISLLIGLSAGYLIKGTEFDNYGAFVKEDQHPFNAMDLQGLVGFRFKMTDRLCIDLRGAYSLMPIRKQPGDPVWYWKSNQFSNVLNTALVYRLDI